MGASGSSQSLPTSIEAPSHDRGRKRTAHEAGLFGTLSKFIRRLRGDEPFVPDSSRNASVGDASESNMPDFLVEESATTPSGMMSSAGDEAASGFQTQASATPGGEVTASSSGMSFSVEETLAADASDFQVREPATPVVEVVVASSCKSVCAGGTLESNISDDHSELSRSTPPAKSFPVADASEAASDFQAQESAMPAGEVTGMSLSVADALEVDASEFQFLEPATPAVEVVEASSGSNACAGGMLESNTSYAQLEVFATMPSGMSFSVADASEAASDLQAQEFATPTGEVSASSYAIISSVGHALEVDASDLQVGEPDASAVEVVATRSGNSTSASGIVESNISDVLSHTPVARMVGCVSGMNSCVGDALQPSSLDIQAEVSATPAVNMLAYAPDMSRCAGVDLVSNMSEFPAEVHATPVVEVIASSSGMGISASDALYPSGTLQGLEAGIDTSDEVRFAVENAAEENAAEVIGSTTRKTAPAEEARLVASTEMMTRISPEKVTKKARLGMQDVSADARRSETMLASKQAQPEAAVAGEAQVHFEPETPLAAKVQPLAGAKSADEELPSVEAKQALASPGVAALCVEGVAAVSVAADDVTLPSPHTHSVTTTSPEEALDREHSFFCNSSLYDAPTAMPASRNEAGSKSMGTDIQSVEPYTTPRTPRKANRAMRGRSQATIHEDFRPGSVARIIGLRTATELNGLEVSCGAWDPDKGRVVVRVPSGEIKNVLPDNLEIVTPASVPYSPMKPRFKCRGLPMMDFDKKLCKDLSPDDLFRWTVYLAVEHYISMHVGSWTLSVMRMELCEEKGWEDNASVDATIRASLLKLGIAELGARV